MAPGPLLYHYEEMDGEPSVELSYTELRHVITSLGFNIEVRRFAACSRLACGRRADTSLAPSRADAYF